MSGTQMNSKNTKNNTSKAETSVGSGVANTEKGKGRTLKDLVADCLNKVAKDEGFKSAPADLQVILQNQPGKDSINISGLREGEYFQTRNLYETVKGLAQGIDESGTKGIENAMKDLEEFVFFLESATIEYQPNNSNLKANGYLDIKFQKITVPAQRDREAERAVFFCPFSKDMLVADSSIQKLLKKAQSSQKAKNSTPAVNSGARESSEQSAPTEELSPGRPLAKGVSKIEEESVGAEKKNLGVSKPAIINNSALGETSESVRVCSPARGVVSAAAQQVLAFGSLGARSSVTAGIKKALQLFHESRFLKPLSGTQPTSGAAAAGEPSQAPAQPETQEQGKDNTAAAGLFASLKCYKARVVELESQRVKTAEDVVKAFMGGETDFQEDVQNMAGVLLENTVRHLEARCKETEDVKLAIKNSKELYESLCKEKDRKAEQVTDFEKKNEKLVTKCSFTQEAIVKFEEELTSENGAVVDLKAKYRARKAETEKIHTQYENMKSFVKGLLGHMEGMDQDTARGMLGESSNEHRDKESSRYKRSVRARSSSRDSREEYLSKRDRDGDRDRKGYRVEEYSVRNPGKHSSANMERALEMLKQHKAGNETRRDRDHKDYYQKGGRREDSYGESGKTQ